jgi:hypothetical protein
LVMASVCLAGARIGFGSGVFVRFPYGAGKNSSRPA